MRLEPMGKINTEEVMKRGLFALCTLILLAAPQPVWGGGAVYVPLALDREIDGNHFKTEILVYNDAAETRTLTYLFIKERANGMQADRGSEPVEVSVAPRRTERFDDLVPGNQIGILEINADEDIFVTARLIGTPAAGGEPLRVELPVVTSRNAVAAGTTAVLPGLKRTDGESLSDYYLLNLNTDYTECAIEVFRRDGGQLFGPVTLFQFMDALGLLNVTDAEDLSIATTCDALTHPFATVHDLETAQMLYIPPAGGGTSTLEVPGAPFVCPAGSTCFEYPDTFFVPTRSGPVRTIYMKAPAGTYTKVHLQMEVLHGGWQSPSSGLHNIFWFVLERNRDMIGYVNLMGPNQNQIMLRHGFGLSHGEKPKIEQHLKATPGETYLFDYLYDTNLGIIELLVLNGGKEMTRVFATPNVNKIDVPQGKRFRIDISFTPGLNPNEPPTYGWQYRNLRVEFAP